MEDLYLRVVALVDAEFTRNRELHGGRIHCCAGCSECCHHRFQITEIEAEYIAKGVRTLPDEVRRTLLARAREYLEAPADARLPCPALENGSCSIYEYRPLMCHKFGMPLYNPDKPGQIFACELNFKDGEEIHDPNLVQIQTGIHHVWKALQAEYKTSGGRRQQEPLNVARAIQGS